MINFQYARASDVSDAVRQIAADPTAKFIAGGTNLLDLMKVHVEQPDAADRHLAIAAQDRRRNGGRRLRIGALAPNSDLAYHPFGRQTLSGCSRPAILAGASAQLRNMASTAATCCSERAAFISTIPRRLQQARAPAAVARRSAASTASMPSWAPAKPASRRILPTCAWRWQRSRPRSMWRGLRRAHHRIFRISIACPATRHSVTPTSMRTRSSPAVELPAQGFCRQLQLPEDP